MSIQLIDNFDLNSPKPIDNRFVVGSQSFYTDKDQIPFKYPGMRVWDFNFGAYGIPFVWNGSTYSAESSSNVSGGGSSSYLTVFTSPTTIGNSVIYQNGTQLSVNNGNSFTTGYSLTVNGGVSVIGTAGFKGDGSQITSINASNITSGSMSLSRLANSPNPNRILTSGSGGVGLAQFVDPLLLTVGGAQVLVPGTTILGIPFNGLNPVQGNIGNINKIFFGNGVANKVTLEYPNYATGAKTLRIPQLSNTISLVAVQEQANNFIGTQSITGVVYINKSAEALRLTTIAGGDSYISWRAGTNEVATIGSGGAGNSNIEIINKNTGFIVFRTNAGTLTSPSLVSHLSINPNGVLFGSGTFIKSIHTGSVRIYQNGTAPLILKGTGFTLPVSAGDVTSGNTPYISVQLTAAPPDFVVVASIVGTDTTNPPGFRMQLSTEKSLSSNKFRIYVAFDGGIIPSPWTGYVDVNFICMGI
jgi:hypothetical protein